MTNTPASKSDMPRAASSETRRTARRLRAAGAPCPASLRLRRGEEIVAVESPDGAIVGLDIVESGWWLGAVVQEVADALDVATDGLTARRVAVAD
jgi:hypothetical protein